MLWGMRRGREWLFIIYTAAYPFADDDIDRAAFDAMANHQIGFLINGAAMYGKTMQKLPRV